MTLSSHSTPKFRTIVLKKESAMLTVLALAAIYGAARLLVLGVRSLQSLPHSNDDWVYF